MKAVLAYLLFAGAAVAGTCPPAPDHSVELARLMEEVRSARSEAQAQTIVGRMWQLWSDAPDELAAAVMEMGDHLRDRRDFDGALAEFSWLTGHCPEYAEGWNQRAMVHFMTGDYAAALSDLDRALALNPTHLGALSGRVMTLMALGREDEALDQLRLAVGLNPWLPERRLLDGAGGAPVSGESDL